MGVSGTTGSSRVRLPSETIRVRGRILIRKILLELGQS